MSCVLAGRGVSHLRLPVASSWLSVLSFAGGEGSEAHLHFYYNPWVHSSQVSSPVYAPEAGVESGAYVLGSSTTTTGTPPASSFPSAPRPSTALLQDVTSLAVLSSGPRAYFTVLDPELQVRVLEKRAHWSDHQCVAEALRMSRHLSAPVRVSVLRRPLSDFPVPQVLLAAYQFPLSSRSVVVDLRPAGKLPCVIDLPFGASIFSGLASQRVSCASGAAHQAVARGDFICVVEGAIWDAFKPVPVPATLVTLSASRISDSLGSVDSLPEVRRQVSADRQIREEQRALDEVSAEIADPPWIWVTFHLPEAWDYEDGPVALYTQLPTSSSLEEIEALASRHFALFRRHHSLQLMFPQLTPVGSGSLLHIFVSCDGESLSDHTLALFDGRAIAAHPPCVYSARIPLPFCVAELVSICRDLWPSASPVTAVRVNNEEVTHNHDLALRFPLVQPLPRHARPRGRDALPPFTPLRTHEILARLPGVQVPDGSALTSTSTTTSLAGAVAERSSVSIVFGVPGQDPHSVVLEEGFHIVDALWRLFSDPA